MTAYRIKIESNIEFRIKMELEVRSPGKIFWIININGMKEREETEEI